MSLLQTYNAVRQHQLELILKLCLNVGHIFCSTFTPSRTFPLEGSACVMAMQMDVFTLKRVHSSHVSVSITHVALNATSVVLVLCRRNGDLAMGIMNVKVCRSYHHHHNHSTSTNYHHHIQYSHLCHHHNHHHNYHTTIIKSEFFFLKT